MTPPPRILSGSHVPALPPVCPKCHDRSFVRQEQLVSNDGTTTATFWLCASCLSLWPVEVDPAG
jgi:DNA-directed RNA polymerase subunit M/transcription elongation factor TFIIS